MKVKSLTAKQESVLKSLRENYDVKYRPKGPNTFECHEVTLGGLIVVWIKPNGEVIAVDSKRNIRLWKCQPIH